MHIQCTCNTHTHTHTTHTQYTHTHRQRRALLDGDFGGEDAQGRKKAQGVVDFVRNASLAASHGYWQIIEWQATDVAGEYVVWAMTSKSQMQKLKVGLARLEMLPLALQALTSRHTTLPCASLQVRVPQSSAWTSSVGPTSSPPPAAPPRRWSAAARRSPLGPLSHTPSPWASLHPPPQVVVPRVMYVNCRGREAEEAALALDGARIKRDLPHARPLGTLFEVAIPERKFIRNEKALALFLCDPQVTPLTLTLTELYLSHF